LYRALDTEKAVKAPEVATRQLTGRLAHNPSAARHVPWVLVLVFIATVPWGVLSALRASPIPPNTPPTLDRFLAEVASSTGPRSRILVTGSLPALVFYRATYRLYPRAVIGYLVRPYTSVYDWVGEPDSWSAAVRYGRRFHVRYVALWGDLPAPEHRILWRRDGGVLVELPA
jgi:hypothetical protein